MEYNQLVYLRKSKRWYLSKPVETILIEEIIEEANQSPSFMNHQPWEVAVATGETLQKIVNFLEEMSQTKGTLERSFPWPDRWPKRQAKLLAKTKETMGERQLPNDPLSKWNYNAPVVLYLHLHRDLNVWSAYDLGAFAQTLMLSAANRGLATVTQARMANQPDDIRKILGLSDERKLIVGITLGYADDAHPNNAKKSPRDDKKNFVTWHK